LSHTNRPIIAALSLGVSALLLSACGGGSSLVSVSAIAKCTHARQQPVSSLPANATSQRQVVAKVAAGGWLRQDYSFVEQTERKIADYELYVFGSAQAAGEAFTLISRAPNAKEEYGAGGTFRRKNVILNTDQGEASSLTANAETLLNKCVGAGASQSTLRPPEEMLNGQTRSEITKAEEDGHSLPSTREEPHTSAPPAGEPGAATMGNRPGEIPAPGDG
jgi:hypothetical protein